jgi:hypothetical protein
VNGRCSLKGGSELRVFTAEFKAQVVQRMLAGESVSRLSGVARCFSPRKITLRYAFKCVSGVGGQQHAVDRQAAGSYGRVGAVAGCPIHQAPKSRHSAQYIPQTRDRITSFQYEFNPPMAYRRAGSHHGQCISVRGLFSCH